MGKKLKETTKEFLLGKNLWMNQTTKENGMSICTLIKLIIKFM